VVEAQVWTVIGLLATALFILLVQVRGTERSLVGRLTEMDRRLGQRISDLTTEMHRGFGEVRGDIAVLRAQINREGQ
jgi:hypothetical protein